MKNSKKWTINSTTSTFFIFLVLFALSCNWGCKSTMVEQQNILRQRIIEYYEQSKKDNNYGFSYDFLIPQWRQLISRDYYLGHNTDLKINDYTIESITIDGEIALVIVQIKYFLDKEIKKKDFLHIGVLHMTIGI